MLSTRKRWYLCQLKPQRHKLALRNLHRQGFEVFLPLVEETRRRGSGFATERRPLFPGYIFVQVDLSKEDWQRINSTSGVSRIVSFGDRPAAVPEEIVAGLLERADEDGLVANSSRAQVGSEVKLTTGPFADFVARIELIEPDRRIWVLIELLGRTTRLRVDEAGFRPA